MSKTVPENIKTNVRAVLLSKVGGGVLVSNFCKDYKSLVGSTLNYKNLGFDSVKEFIEAIPDVVRLEYDEQIMATRMFGKGDDKSYMSLSMKRAEGKGKFKPGQHHGKDSNFGQMAKAGGGGSSIRDIDKLVPNPRGLYSLCYPQNKELKGIKKEEVLQKFSQFGNVGEVHMIPGLIFVRFCTKEGAIAALQMYSESLELRSADEKKSKGKGDWDRKGKHQTGSENDSMFCKRDNKIDVPISNGGGSPGKIDVFMGNLDHKCKADDVREFVKEYKPLDVRVRMPKGDATKAFAFLTFSTDQMETVQAMIKRFNGEHWRGRRLVVNLDKETSGSGNAGKGKNKNQTDKASSGGFKQSQSKKFVEPQGGDDWDDEDDEEEMIKPAMTQTVQKPNYSPASTGLPSNHSPGIPGPLKNQSPSGIPNPGPGLLPTPNVSTLPSAPILTQTSDIQFKLAQESLKSNINVGSVLNKMRELTINTDVNSDIRAVSSALPRADASVRSSRPVVSPSSSVHSQRSAGSYPGSRGHKNITQNGLLSQAKNSTTAMSDPLDDMPMLEPAVGYAADMPALAPIENEPRIFIGGFPYGESDEELLTLFEMYGAKSIEVINRNMSPYSTKAAITVETWEQVEQAISDLDQTYFKGRRILVDYYDKSQTYQKDSPRKNNPVHGPMTVAQRGPHSVNSPGLGPGGDNSNRSFRSRSSSTTSSSSEEVRAKSFTSMLQTYKVIMYTLRLKPHQVQLPCEPALHYVLVTSVYDNMHFWGQVINDDGVLKSLETIMTDLQDPDSRIGPTRGLGRCSAKFEGDWFRGWIVAEMQSGYQVKVFYVDYGNMALVDKRDTSLTTPDVWETKPFLRPFRVSGSKVVSKEMENKLIAVRVLRSGIDETEYLTEVMIENCDL